MYGRKSSQYKKRSSKRYNTGSAATAKKALSLAKKAIRLPELKWSAVVGAAPTSVAGAGSNIHVINQTVGNTNNERIGDQICPTSINFRMTVKLGAAATDTLVRMIVYRWFSGAPAGVTSVLQTASYQSFTAEDTHKNFQILKDQMITLNSANVPERFLSFKIPYKHKIQFPGGATQANKNGIWVIFISDEAVQTPTISYDARLYFRDS